MEKTKMIKRISRWSWSFMLLLLFTTGCEKSPFDYRNKWTGDWELVYDVYYFGNFTSEVYTELVVIEKVKDNDLGKALSIDPFTFGVDRDGNLSIAQGKDQSIDNVGTIDKNKLYFEVNTSINGPGILYKVTGTKID